MLRIARARSVAVVLAAAAAAGCGKVQSIPAPVAPNASLFEGATGSWMKPQAKNADLLYVADLNRNAVFVFTYPAGDHVGTLRGFSKPHGECADAAGNVWVTNGTAQNLVEYAHGGTTRIATLADPNGFPAGCAVDPVTGNLAVMNFSLGSGAGSVVVYAGAKGAPQQLPLSTTAIPYRGVYDKKGNLWISGMTSDARFVVFSEYLAVRQRWRYIRLTKHVFALPSGLQWLGDELVVGDQGPIDSPSSVYEFSVRRGVGRLVGSTPLTNSCNMLEFVVIGKTIVTGNICEKAVRYFAFPGGGTSTRAIRSGLSQPIGVVLSRP